MGYNSLGTYLNSPLDQNSFFIAPHSQPMPGTRLHGAEMASKMAKGTQAQREDTLAPATLGGRYQKHPHVQMGKP